MKSDHDRRLARTTAIIAAGNLSTKCLNFLLLPFYTSFISREVYGIVDLLSTYVSLLLPFVNLQLWNAVFAFLAKSQGDEERSKEIISNSFFMTFLLLGIFLVPGVISCRILGGGAWFFILFSVPAEAMLAMTTNASRGLGRNIVYAAGNLISSASTLIINIILLAVLKIPSIYILVSYVLGPIFGSLYAFIRGGILRYISSRAIKLSSCREILSFSVPLIPNEISWWVLSVSDRTVLTFFLGLSATGLIVVANRFATIYNAIYNVFHYAWVEQCLTLYKKEDGDEYLSSAMFRMWRLFACFSMLFIAAVSIAFNFMVNPQYQEAYGLVAIYSLAAFAKLLIGLTEPFLLRENKTLMISLSAMAAGIVNLLVDLGSIGYIGIYASPVSSLVAFVLIGIWRLYIVNKKYISLKIDYKSVFLVFAGMGFAVFSFYHYQENIILKFISFLLIGAFCLILLRQELKGFISMAKERILKMMKILKGNKDG